jgi:acetoin utilization deacetylase AcuC-like enzyme
MPMTDIGYIFHPSYLLHDTGASHPESAARLESIMSHLKCAGLLDRLVNIDARRATAEELSLVHTQEYQHSLKTICLAGAGSLDADTLLSQDSCNAAEYAAGGAVAAVEAVMDGRVRKCFALVRPPGHHAFAGSGSGFCLYNNIAIAARYARLKYHLARIAIIDFDIHHGNGTQAIFNADPLTMYVSTHQSPHYPGTGGIEEIGTGKAKGTKINIPLPPGCGDAEYIRVYNGIVVPAVRRFNPELILVSAGYDAHRDDQLADMRLTEPGYTAIVEKIDTLAGEYCGGKAVFCLEGGYNLRALARSVAATFRVLLGDTAIEKMPVESPIYQLGAPDISGLIAGLKGIHHLCQAPVHHCAEHRS